METAVVAPALAAAATTAEEAIEVVIDAMNGENEAVVRESADLLYHLMVVLKIADIPLQAVMQELERRTAQTGLNEKASRQDP